MGITQNGVVWIIKRGVAFSLCAVNFAIIAKFFTMIAKFRYHSGNIRHSENSKFLYA